MTRRQTLWGVLVLLVLLLFAAPAVGGVGPVELGIWTLLVLAWVVVYFTWGSRRHDQAKV